MTLYRSTGMPTSLARSSAPDGGDIPTQPGVIPQGKNLSPPSSRRKLPDWGSVPSSPLPRVSAKDRGWVRLPPESHVPRPMPTDSIPSVYHETTGHAAWCAGCRWAVPSGWRWRLPPHPQHAHVEIGPSGRQQANHHRGQHHAAVDGQVDAPHFDDIHLANGQDHQQRGLPLARLEMFMLLMNIGLISERATD